MELLNDTCTNAILLSGGWHKTILQYNNS